MGEWKQFNIDIWWKAILMLGILTVSGASLFQIEFLEIRHLFGLGLGLILIGLGFWKSYKTYTHMSHALCHAHHLRDLTAVSENSQQIWASEMKTFLLKAKEWVATAQENGQTALTSAQLHQLTQEYEAILARGWQENPTPTQRAKGKSFNLLKRFAEQREAIWQFILNFQVPFDNNLAERDLRMMKVQQKISGCFRSSEGAAQFCELRSYLSTIRKQGLSVWEALGSLFQGSPLSPFAPPV